MTSFMVYTFLVYFLLQMRATRRPIWVARGRKWVMPLGLMLTTDARAVVRNLSNWKERRQQLMVVPDDLSTLD